VTRTVTWAGLAVVGLAAATLSFASLRQLALAVTIPSPLAPLLPIAVDAGAAVSTAVWLTPRTPVDASRWARGMTWSLLVATVVGNAAQQGLRAHQLVPAWWVAVLVGAVPPAVVGAIVHLAVLVGRGVGRVDLDARVAPVNAHVPAIGDETHPADPATVAVNDLESRARQLVADGAGRPTLRRELGVTDHQAKKLLDLVKTNGHTA
jgi:Protein of unknown function (DUF2637)